MQRVQDWNRRARSQRPSHARGRVPGSAIAAMLVAAFAAGCSGTTITSPGQGVFRSQEVTLSVKLAKGTGDCSPGTTKIQGHGVQPIRLWITTGGGGRPRALLVSLHGAGGSAKGALMNFRAVGRRPGVVIVAPASSGSSWNLGLRADIRIVERAIRIASRRCRIDPERVAVGGFSAGATYAVILGLSNGNLFHDVIALSPSAVAPQDRVAKPRVFVAHGRQDDVIPIEYGGGALVPALRDAGYDVTFHRFGDGHDVTDGVSAAAARWWLGTS